MSKGNTADLEELSQYVFIHPEDYQRRWTLAKKLYMAWEYGDALKHLLILKKNWTRKLNVLRYLAATYYRLGRYDEAIAELQAITQQWPNEIAVWEQLARVYEIAGRKADAAHTWERVLRVDAQHPTAARSIQRLRSPSLDSPREDLRLRDSDSGIDLAPYRVCGNCGAQNSDEFERCWQCHAALDAEGPPVDSIHAVSAPRTRVWLRTFVGGMATVCAVSAGLYVTIQAMRRAEYGVPSGYGPVYDLLAEVLFAPRVASFVALTAAWPVGLWCGFRFTGAQNAPWPSLFGAGLLLASLTYLTMWVPVPWLLYGPILPAIVSLVVILSLSGGKIGPGFAAWIIHGAFPLFGGIAGFVSVAGIGPIVQLPAIVSYDKTMSSLKTPDAIPFYASPKGSGGCTVEWAATDSRWLDEAGRRVVIEVAPEDPGEKVLIDLALGKTSIGAPGPGENRITAEVRPGVLYTFRVTASENAAYVVRSHGVLLPTNRGNLMK